MTDHLHVKPIGQHEHHDPFGSTSMASHTELEGEFLYGLVRQATEILGESCDRYSIGVGRILDIGCGPGVGTCALAWLFDGADVVAVDRSAAMLAGVNARARRLGVAPRVETRQLELPVGLTAIGRADIVWASQVLHHLDNQTKSFRDLRRLLEPGGLLAIVEPAGPMRVVPGDVDLGRPGIWDRIDTAWAAWFSDTFTNLPELFSEDNSQMLEDYGLELVTDQIITLSLAPLTMPARRFAHNYVLQIQRQLGAHADPADLRALDALTASSDQGIIRRHDARIYASRSLWLARAVSDFP